MKLNNFVCVMFVFIAVAIIFSGCEPPDESALATTPGANQETLSEVGKILVGEHLLHRVVTPNENDIQIGGQYFVFIGSNVGDEAGAVAVKFIWRMNDGTFANSSLPFERFRVNYDNNITEPTIKFRWRPVNFYRQLEDIMAYDVLYAVITVKESDWPVKIQLPVSPQ